MIVLTIFAFLAGVVTILSPCILPVLPIILSSSIDSSGYRRPAGVVTGFVLSFTFFTLFLSTLVRLTGVSADLMRQLSIVILVLFGLSQFSSTFQVFLEKMFSRLSALVPSSQGRTGFGGGLVIGFSLGLLWTPCVGPILASVISLALTGSVTLQAFFITLAYALGTSLPMFLVIIAGNQVLRKHHWLLSRTAKIQKVFGMVMILTAIAIFFNVDRRFQTFVLQTFPSYGTGLTSFEDNDLIRNTLDDMGSNKMNSIDLQMGKDKETTPNKSSLPTGPLAPELIIGGEWFNSAPVKLADLRGKVVLVDFWTYTCINCIRTLPYLRTWWEKYEDEGLVIIGVHAPEFEFEKSASNVKKAIADFELKYPVMQDNDFATWRAYENRYWPAKYLIDKEGHIRYTHFGEGEYDKTERNIQALLSENSRAVDEKIENPEYEIYSRTPETYLGYWRIDNFASPEGVAQDRFTRYSYPSSLSDDEFAYSGDWSIMEKYSSAKKGAKLKINFESKEVFLVMRPEVANSVGKAKVVIDISQTDSMATNPFGMDVKDSQVTVDSDRLYKLINLPAPGSHEMEIEFLDDNIEVYAFTFG